MRSPRLFLRLTTPLLVALLGAIGVLAPLLEREPTTVVSIEAQHDEDCRPLHDHGLCVQLQHARALPRSTPAHPLGGTVVEHAAPRFVQLSISTATRSPTQARAPPLL